jgi:D-sedoheptulose 7-phosphate isomerase
VINMKGGSLDPLIATRLRLAGDAHHRLAASGTVATIDAAGAAMRQALADGKTILVFGNGGSATDAQHFVTELVVRYERDRPARSAVALTGDSAVLTATGNDYGFEQLFARQVDALGRAGDVALAMTTSGQSPNVIRGLEAATARGLMTIALTGRDGGQAGKLARVHVNVPEQRTAVVQEVHRTILHIWCELIDRE